MTTISPHTTRAPGTILTAAIYNLDHGNHIANAQALNAGKIEGAGSVVDGAVAVFDGVSGSALRSGGGAPVLTPVDTSDISNDAVTYAKLQNAPSAGVIGAAASGDYGHKTLSEVLDFIGSAAQGDILYRGASAWERLAADTSGQFLQTQGTGANPQWANGAVVPVATGAVSSVATLDLALGSADMYEIDLINISPATDSVALYARFSQSSSFLSGATDYGWNYFRGATEQSDASDSEIGVADAVGNGATEFSTITFRIFRPSAAAFQKGMHWQGYECFAADGHIRHINGAGRLIANTNAIDGVRFLFSSGNIASATYAIRSYSFT